MANLVVPITTQQTLSSSATAAHQLGTQGETADGRLWRYALAGVANLVAGNVIQGPAQVANHLALTPAAAAIGATTVTVTLGATAATVNQYAGGLVVVDTTPGEGISYLIKGHAAVLSGGVITLNLVAEDGIQVAWTTATRVNLIANPYSGVIQAPVTTATSAAVGVAPFAITAAQFGWIQTWGACGVLITGTPAVGAQVVGTGAVAGAAAIASSTLGVIGRMLQTGVDTKINGVFLTLD